ncbi:cystinosin homolog isoform X2 [Chrysoperla carnea]|uniref:cystinosin homolog isoform X2 n=1 Tax=Chrysoperla carnea TaxID=189513 RepID=UPI001D060FB1|nr:cystinosin homolog isoform X2 [Chrysoperla carnea]
MKPRKLNTPSVIKFLLYGLLVLGLFDSILAKNDETSPSISIDRKSMVLVEGLSDTFTLNVSGAFNENITIFLLPQHSDIISVSPNIIEIEAPQNNTSQSYSVCISAGIAGHSALNFNSTPPDLFDTNKLFIRVTVEKSDVITQVSSIIGWIYFAAWSISFYPQIYINFKRKSVVGLNFDFISLNIVGFLLYSVFNCGLYFIPKIKSEFASKYPRSVIPVQVNDIVFALHATFATIVTILQCFIYERDNQRVSFTAIGIICVFGLFVGVTCILAITGTILWLDFINCCSSVKLCITLIKYIPQAYMNYKRKSTVGWSIGNIFLDFTGGLLSMLQMILSMYNYNDWISILSDPTKFGLGFFSVAFDIFFMIQHYVLYRESTKTLSITKTP